METLKSINPNKATSPDHIPSKVLKITSETVSPSLTAFSDVIHFRNFKIEQLEL